MGRHNYIDWLRMGAMSLLVFYHSGRLFDEPGWHIKNGVQSDVINIFNRFLDIWHMPLFFILAGASAWLALGHRGAGEFAKERLLRLFVPLVFGMLIIVPPQVYYERIFDGDFTGPFLAWYPNIFHGIYSMDNPATGNLSWHHLWFLAYLSVFSMLLLPLLWYLRSEKRKGLISRLAVFIEKPGAIFIPAAPLIIYNILLRPIYGWGNQNLINDWANFAYYITVFFYGFMLVSDGRLLVVVQRNRFAALIAAAVFSIGIYVGDGHPLRLPGAVLLSFYAIACWCWLVAIIGIASLMLNSANRALRYANEAVLPVYILHQTVIVMLGFYIIQWDTGVAPKYLAVVALTFVICLAIYEAVKRTGVTRFLFGIKPRKR